MSDFFDEAAAPVQEQLAREKKARRLFFAIIQNWRRAGLDRAHETTGLVAAIEALDDDAWESARITAEVRPPSGGSHGVSSSTRAVVVNMAREWLAMWRRAERRAS